MPRNVGNVRQKVSTFARGGNMAMKVVLKAQLASNVHTIHM